MCTNGGGGGFREPVVGATGSAATGAQQAEVGSIGIPAASDLGATTGRVSAGTGNNAAFNSYCLRSRLPISLNLGAD